MKKVSLLFIMIIMPKLYGGQSADENPFLQEWIILIKETTTALKKQNVFTPPQLDDQIRPFHDEMVKKPEIIKELLLDFKKTVAQFYLQDIVEPNETLESIQKRLGGEYLLITRYKDPVDLPFPEAFSQKELDMFLPILETLKPELIKKDSIQNSSIDDCIMEEHLRITNFIRSNHQKEAHTAIKQLNKIVKDYETLYRLNKKVSDDSGSINYQKINPLLLEFINSRKV